MKDSTLYWDPRNMTDAKSTPNTRANSLDRQLVGKGMDAIGNVRIFGDDLGSIDDFDIHDHPLKIVLEYTVGMFQSLALP
jgi:hypothetical protein